MKQKSKKQVSKKRSEFRHHKVELINSKGKKINRLHPAYVLLEKGNIYIYVSLTHASKVNGLLVIKLKKNPNPKDKNDSYVVVDVSEDTKDRFGKRHKDWKIYDEDDLKIREMINKK